MNVDCDFFFFNVCNLTAFSIDGSLSCYTFFVVAYFFDILDKIFLKLRQVITIYEARIRCIPVSDTRRCLTRTHMITLNYFVFSRCYWCGRVSVFVVSSVHAPLITNHVILLYSYNCKVLSYFFLKSIFGGSI
jgi:hypothetical protein